MPLSWFKGQLVPALTSQRDAYSAAAREHGPLPPRHKVAVIQLESAIEVGRGAGGLGVRAVE